MQGINIIVGVAWERVLKFLLALGEQSCAFYTRYTAGMHVQ